MQVKVTNFESASGLKYKGAIPLHEDDQIKFNEKRYAYLILSTDASSTPYPSVKIAQKLTFKITEIDVESQDELGEYDEEYTQLQDLTVSTKDYLKAMVIPTGSYMNQWENLGAQGQRDGNLSELTQTFQLPFKSMNVAVNGVIQFFGNMSVCDKTNKINVTEKVHNLFLRGIFNGSFQVFVKGQIGFNQEYGCVIKLTVRSLDAAVSKSLLECIN